MTRDECYAEIKKCNDFLKEWDMNGYRKSGTNTAPFCDKVPPEEVVAQYRKIKQQVYDGGGQPESDWDIVIFWANAKYGLIMRLVSMQEAENAVSLA